MEPHAIRAEAVGKKFATSLRRSMLYGAADIMRTAIGVGSRPERLRRDEFWAVDGVDFELERGRVLGLIGPNGSGKTTLLKMLGGIFLPDRGRIEIRGRVGALIQVGAGFHPLLSGRENVYVNAAILGASRDEIEAQFDSIVEFAELGSFIDAPVRHYSSGMYVRLGFSVAVHCQPEILLIDEILAVGDMAFQTKCLKRMNELRRSGEVTIVFVSHNLISVERFCDEVLFLERGRVVSRGETRSVIRDYQAAAQRYLAAPSETTPTVPGIPHRTGELRLTDVRYLDADGRACDRFESGSELRIEVAYQTTTPVDRPIVQISLANWDGVHVAVFGTQIDGIATPRLDGTGTLECRIPSLPVLLQRYFVTVTVYDESNQTILDYWNGTLHDRYFEVGPDPVSEKLNEYTPIYRIPASWSF